MNKEQMNKIVKAAQEKFDEAKNLILQEMQVALDEAEHGNVSTDDAIDKIIDNFITTATAQVTINDEDGGSEDDEISWINEDAIDFDKEYNEIGILIQKDEDGNRKVAVEYDSELSYDELYALLAMSMAEVLYDTGDYAGAVTKEEICDAIVGGVTNAIIKLAAKKVIDILG